MKPRKFVPHPIHGDNYTICRCFWCGKARNELYKLGNKVPGEAPIYLTVDYKPCVECEARRKGNLLMVEVTTEANGHFAPISTSKNGVSFYPTRKWATALIDEAVMMFEPHLRDALRRDGIAFMDTKIFNAMLNLTKPENGTGTSQSTTEDVGGPQPNS